VQESEGIYERYPSKTSTFEMRPTKRCLQAFACVGCNELQSKNKREREKERERVREPVDRRFPANCPRCFKKSDF